MSALVVVKHFHVLEQAGLGLVSGVVIAMHHQLGLQGMEETLHRRIIPLLERPSNVGKIRDDLPHSDP